MSRRGTEERPWSPSRLWRGVRRYGPGALGDCLIVGSTYVLALFVRTGGRSDVLDPQVAPYSFAVAMGAGVVQVGSNLLFDVYWRDWSAAALEDMVSLVKATFLVVVALLAFNLATEAHWMPTGAILAGGSLSLVAEAAFHLRPRWPQIGRAALGRHSGADNLVVVGAGRLGRLLASDIAGGGRDYQIACFVDDNVVRAGTWVKGVRVEGRIQDLPRLIDRYHPRAVVIAVNNPPGALIRRIVDECAGRDVRIRRVSGFSLMSADNSPLQPIGIEELLAREPVDLSRSAANERYAGKKILITGAAGSIGSELARQLTKLRPSDLYLLDSNESGLHSIQQSIGGDSFGTILLGDIRDRPWLRHVFAKVRPDVVFHAAAYKHVPILERTPLPGIATNVLGTANVLQSAAVVGVDRFVFVSTDKAVEPTSVLGYTKRFGELYTRAIASESGRNYAVVRFGNVLGSVGSAVPIFSGQIDRGGPVTVTHPDATRYFMTIQEAVSLLIEAGALAAMGDVLVLDMGHPVSIAELAQKMIRLRGLRTPEDISIEYIGLRPGEKLEERLVSSEEAATGTEHPRLLHIESREARATIDVLQRALAGIEDRVEHQDPDAALDILVDVIGSTRLKVTGVAPG